MLRARDGVGASTAGSPWTIARCADSVRSRSRDYLHLTKARLSLMVVLSGVVGYWLAATGVDAVHASWFTLGTFLVVGGANAFNQIVERVPDGRMARTADRPLPTGRIGVGEATFAASLMSVSGLALLFLGCGALTASLGLGALLVYVLLYTPLKMRSFWSILPGAVAGATPTLMGWSAASGTLAPGAWYLFGILFFWQFPHTWAIAAAYSEDYERVGYRSLPRHVVPFATMTATLALVVTTLVPALFGAAGPAYSSGAVVLGAIFVAVALRFGDGSSRARASQLLAVSLFYLPLILALAAFDAFAAFDGRIV